MKNALPTTVAVAPPGASPPGMAEEEFRFDDLRRRWRQPGLINLACNESPLGASPGALEAVAAGAATIHRYPSDEYRRLQEDIAASRGPGVTSENVVIANGSSELASLVVRALLQPGDEVLLSEPTWPVYRSLVTARGGHVNAVANVGHRCNMSALVESASDRTRMVFVCNPNNPTGSIVRHREVEHFLAALPEQAVVVFDEAYAEFVSHPDFREAPAVTAGRPVIVLRTFSKAYGLAGLRVGYAIGPAELLRGLSALRLPYANSGIGLAAARAALADTDFLRRGREFVAGERERVGVGLRRCGFVDPPSHASFLFADTADRHASEIARELLRLGIWVRVVGDSALRVSIGSSRENDALLAALRELVPRPVAADPIGGRRSPR
jgi:histidinol-phosphate aminotransferase